MDMVAPTTAWRTRFAAKYLCLLEGFAASEVRHFLDIHLALKQDVVYAVFPLDDTPRPGEAFLCEHT